MCLCYIVLALTLDSQEIQGGRRIKMKKGIHPNYKKVTVTCASCGNEFQTGSVVEAIKVDTCSNCHPFYTGRQRFAAAQGRIDKFNRKYGMK